MKKDNLEAIYPLSPTQEGMLFHSLYAPQQEVYFEQFSYALQGELDSTAFKEAWRQIVAAHPVLRTLFLWEGQEKPLQVVLRQVELPWHEQDWRHLTAQEQAQRLHAWVQSDRAQGFDLTHAPVMRLSLIRMGETSYHFTWSFHHLLLDGWSVFTVMGQVFSHYEALCQGRPMVQLVSRPYRDYIGWLRRQDLGQAERFWRETLRGFTTPTLLDISRSHRRTTELPAEYRRQVHHLSEATMANLQQLARRHQVTLNTLVQGAWALLLARYSGQHDIVFGMTVSGRPPELAGVEAMVGLFINTLPMRVQVSAHEPLIPWLQRLQAQQAEARQYEYSPLVQVQGWSEVPRGQPLFEHLLVFENFPLDASFVQESSLQIEPVLGGVAYTNYPLVVSIIPSAGMMVGVKYAGTHFTDESMQRMLGHFQTLLEGMVANPHRRLAELPLLTEVERQQQLFEWNATQTAYPREKCLHTLFEEQVERSPDAIAVIYEGQQLSYATLDWQATQLAETLRLRGVGPDLLVGICLPRSPEMVIGLLAVLKAGGTYVPLDPTYPQQRIAFVVEDARLKVVLTQEHLKPILPATDAEVICVDALGEHLPYAQIDKGMDSAQLDNLAYVIYTSGSTGRPKGAGVFQRGLCNLMHWYLCEGAISSTDRVILISSPSFDLTQKNIFAPLLVGGVLDIPSDAFYDPHSLIQHIESRQITILNWTPSAFFPLLQEAAKSDFSSLDSLRLIVLGGEPIPVSPLLPWQRSGRCHASILNTYGPTECSDIATCYRLPANFSEESQIPLGRPIDNVRVLILDQQQQLVPVGVRGELCIGGASVGAGYMHNAKLTGDRFMPDPFSDEPGARLYKTGDLARYLANGEIEYVGRVDDQVKVRGYRIEAGEIETVLSRHPAISEVVVLAREASPSSDSAGLTEQQSGDKRLVAYLVARQQPAPSSSELRAFLGQHLPEYMVPSVFLFLDALPILPSGKVDRRALPTPEEIHASLPTLAEAPRTELEQYLAQLWQALLRMESISIHDNFFELGGDSIKAALLINKIQERLATPVYVVALFDAPTVAQLATYLAEHYPEVVRTLFGPNSVPTALALSTTDGRPVPYIDREKVQALRAVIAPLAPPPAHLEQPLSKNPPAVFVLSPPRSGSTLLRVMLAGHPQLFAPPELELLSFQTLGERQAAFSGRNGFWLEGLIRAVMDLKGCDAQSAQRLMAEYEARNLSTHDFYGLLQQWLGPRLLVDKTPAYALDRAILQRGEQEFEQARYLHLLRHPQAVIRSFEEARLDQVFFRHPHAFSRRELAELIWVISQQNIQAFLHTVPAERQYRVVFEELVREPQRVMEGICRFLGVDYDPAMIEPYQGERMTDGISAHSKMIGDIKFHEHRSIDARVAERWKQELEQQELAEVTWELAASLGYERTESKQLAQSRGLPRIAPRRREEQQLPLSYAQERLWFLHQWEPERAAYTIDAIWRLQGELSVEVLNRSLQEIARRHEVLRTSLQAEEGQPRQIIAAQVYLLLPVVDLMELATSEREAQVERLTRELVERPFDLGKAPLLRTMLLRVYAEQHVFALTIHHSISDGWSMGLLFREMSTLYKAFLQGQPLSLPDLPIQYADYALWQRQRLQGETLQRQLAYWRTQLQGAQTLLALPTDRPRPAVQTFVGATHYLTLSTELSNAVRALSQREGVTLFMTLLAAFQTWLACYSQQEDISVGTYIAGRTHFETENLIGFFINNLVLRTDLSGDPSFRVLLKRARQVAQGAYEHQDIPFEKLIQELQPERNPSHTPLFQVMLIYQNMPEHELTLPGLTVQQLRVGGTRSNFDLLLWVTEWLEEKLIFTFQYNTDLFDAATIERWAGHFETLLQAIVANPERRLSALSLLSATELQTVLRDWNANEESAATTIDVEQLLTAQVARTPDTIALVYEEQHLTYAELDHRAEQLAIALQRQGIGPEIAVGICLERSLEMVVAMLGVLKAGAAYVPLDPTYPQERLTFMIRQAQISLLLTQSQLMGRLPSSEARALCLDTDWSAIASGSQPLLHLSNEAERLAYVIYTSGSTGEPKGVAVAHRSLTNFAQAAARLFEVAPGDRVLQFASLSFDASAEEIYPCLLQGGTLVLRTEMMLSDTAHFVQTCQRWGLTVLDLPTAYWHELTLALEREQLVLPHSLRLMIIGGEQALAERLASWQRHGGPQVALINTYGPTETTVAATAHRVRVGEDQEPCEAAVLGRAIANVQLYVLDRYGQPLPIGIPGELYIGGEGIARGYLGRPALTAERFVPNPFGNRPGARLYRTGDLVRLLPDGSLEYRGRVDRQVKLRGFRIELGEIEAVLARHPSVREAVVLLREDSIGEKRLVAYVASEPTQSITSGELRSYVQQQLPAYMLPSSFVQLEAMPRTPNGKVDRRVLPAPQNFSQGRERIWEVPQTPTEELLADLWSQVLHSEQVSRHDHFFESGGHSLLATQLVARVRDLFAIELPLRTIFEIPILSALAEQIEIARDSQQSLQLPPLQPRAVREEMPLSYAQQRLWFLDQLQPDSASYNIPLAMRFTGKLDLLALQGSLMELMRRQEILRTTFTTQQGQPRQIIAAQPTIKLPIVDLSTLSEQEKASSLDQIAQQEAQRPFNLAQGPLLRTTLIQLDHETQVLLLTMHHIITDAWSMGVFFRELTQLYRARINSEPSPLPELTIQYADYACWQRQWLEGVEAEGASIQEQQLAYWRAHLAGAPPLLELPTDHPRPQEQTYRGARHTFTLSPELVSSLRRLGRQEGATLFMLLLTAFGGLLSRYSGQEDLVVGTPIANRRHAQLEGMIGFFVNTLALRLSLSRRLSVREVLRHVREVALGAYAHQDVPFEQVVEVLHPQRDLSHTPLFQVVFVLQNVATAALELPDVNVQLLAVESGIARFDLTLTMQERTQDVLGVLEYNRDLFEPGTIERMAAHLCLLLEGMVAHPEQQMAMLPLVTEAEQRQLLLEWNETRTAYPDDRGLIALFEQQVQHAPDAVALVFGEQQASYSELDARANQLAHYLQQSGVSTETLVGLCLERSIEMVVGILAILKAGGAYVPLDLSYPQERLAFMLQDAQITLLLSQERLQARFATTEVRVVCLDEAWPAIAQQSRQAPQTEASSEHLAYVIYTSGSTGQPKGVQVQQGSVLRLVWGVDYVALDSSVRVLQLAPISFDAATFELWAPLVHGGRCVLFAGELPSVQGIGEVLHREQINLLWLTASLFNVVVDEAPEVLIGLQHLLIGGEALSVRHVRRGLDCLPGVQIVNGYGPTENTTFSCCEPIDPSLPADAHTIPIGRPIANTQTYVLDELGQVVPVGVPGELYLGGAGLARGYLRRPELTAERFVPHPFVGTSHDESGSYSASELGERLYRTGDVVRYLPDGRLEFVGRRDGQVKLRGFRIELGEIEATLMGHAAVRDAVVILHQEVMSEKRLVAYVVAQPPEALVISELRHYLQDRLPEYMVPAAFVQLEALPLTPNGKLDRQALPAPESGYGVLDGVHVAPRTPEEEMLAKIWATVLNLDRVGVHDNFFELGGDSILSIQIVAKATAAGLPLTPRQLFQYQTIAQLAALAGTTQSVAADQQQVQGSMPLLPVQHWFFAQQLAEPQHWNQAVMLEMRQWLDPALFAQALHALLSHHDALRLRARHRADGWQLWYATPDEHIPFSLVDLTALAGPAQLAALSVSAKALQASLNLIHGPIIRAALFTLGGGQPQRLLLIIHHLAVDIVSWSILLEDLQRAYQQLCRGQAIYLPAKTTSFQHWSRRLQEYAQSVAVSSQLAYWLKQPWADVHALPLDMPATRAGNIQGSARAVVITLGAEETQALLSEVHKAYRTQINDVLLTALVLAFARWTGQSALLVHLEGHGREDILDNVDLSRTVGWFTVLVPLVLKLESKQEPGEALKWIKEQLRGIPQGGMSFGLLRYLNHDGAIREQLAALPQPEVSFNYAGRSTTAETEELFASAAELPGPSLGQRNLRPHVLDISGVIVEGQLWLEWVYSENLHHRSTIEQLANAYLEALQTLIRHCQAPEAGGYTPSDFPEAELSQESLDALVVSLSETMAKAGSEQAGKNIEAIYPLSPMQEGMLFHSLYAPHLEVYFEQFTYTLQGELNSAAFSEAWRQIVAAHPVLRTLFLWEGREKPLQVVLQQVELPWHEQDWRHLAAEEQAQRLHVWLQRDQAQGFDLASAPALRLSLIRLGETSYHFIWSFHHLLLDGWSVFTVMGQIFSGYEALCQGKLMVLPASRPYRDYIGWLQRQDLGQAERFWREMLRGFTTPSSLGITRSQLRKAEPVGQYRNQQLRLSEATTTGLQHLARQHQLTLNTLAQGAWALLLARYSGQQDIVFGTTVSGRPPELAGVEAMVGLFINTLPMRVQIAAHERLIPWLQRLQAQQVEARQYEYSPLVQVQAWSEVPRGQPLFEHLLIFANYPADASFVEEISLKIERMQVVERTNYPLTMSITPLAQMLVRVSYAGTHFTDESISRMLAHLQTVLEGMVANPQQRLADLPLLTEAERQQQLFEWNATHTAEPQHICLHALFEAQVERAPEATALFFEEQQLTYSELNARANQLAHYLQHLGVGPEVCVGICVERSIAMIVGVLAVLKAGGAYVPLDPAYPLERLALMLQETQAPVLLTQQSLLPSLQSHQAEEAVGELAREIICLDRDWPSIEREHTCNPHSQVATTNLAYVIYTSGSTGRPKGTLVEQRGLANLVAVQVHAFAIEPTSHVLQFASLSFDAAVSEIFTTLLCGAALFLIPKESLFPGPGLVYRMEEQAISVVTLPPSILSALPAAQLSTLHTLVVAGEASSGALVERWADGRRFLNAYGPTEASVCATIATCTDGSQTPPIGRPIANVQVYVLDPWMQPVPVGVTGELYIASIGLARGYLHRPELTAEYFLPHPFVGTRFSASEPGARLYRTGDLARYLANGELEYVGRRDGQVKVRGYRIEVGEIEAVLSRHPAIGEVVVLARGSSASGEPTEQEDNDKRLVAYLVARQQPAPSSGELRAFLGQRLPEYMLPSVFLFLDTLPTLPNGKVDRRALPTPEEVRTSWQAASQAPRTALEQYLAQLWQGVLKLEAVGIHEHFFELGGDSIKAALLINKVQERFGTLVYAVALFDAPTVAQLASYLAQQYPEVVRTLFGLESLPTAVATMATTRSAQEPCIDREKVQALRAAIAPLAPPPAHLEQPLSKNPPAVFVLSPPRSGSTLLRVMLAGHPQLFAPPELELLSFQTLGERQTAFSGRNGFWLEGLIRAVMDLKGCDAQSAQRLMAEYESQDLPTHTFYGLLQQWLGPRLLVDKTPAYALDRAILQRGEQEFEQARYLHLLRHPQAMIRSFEEARLDQVFFRHPHHFSRRELAELVWVVCQQNIQTFLRMVPPERQHVVVFEELVREPRRVMERLCQFLGVDYDPAMIEPYQGQRMTDGISAHSKMIGDIKFHEHRGIDAGVAERWKQESEQQVVAELTWELAASLGYVRSEGEQPAQGKMLPRIAPRPREEQQLPLSYAQERLWFLQQWEPTQAAYTIDTMLQLQGALSVEMLDRSLQELVRRHEVLRTSLRAEDGQPRQIIATQMHLPLPVVDLTDLATSEREAQVEHLAREQLASPFDLGKAPLLRTTLIRMHAQRHLFVLTMHHSISDGWSMSIFNQELTALYEAFLHGQPSPLPELPIQYADYALWQRGTAHIPELQSQLRYWQRQLADLPLLALPTDHARPSMQRFRGRSLRFRLPEQLTRDLKSLSQREGVTLFMTLLAGFQVLLSRYSGQTDIVVGTPIANRSRSEVEHLIGPFVNTLVLRLDLVDNPTVQQLLAEVRRITLQAYAHQDLPFDKLVEVLNPQRSLSHHPLFQVMFVLHNTPVSSLAMQALQVGLMSVETTIAHFDLTLNLYDSSRGLVGDIEYDRDLFEEETIERLSQHYQQLLLAMTSSPEKRALTLPLLTEGEQQQLRSWNATAMSYAHDICFHDLFEEQAQRTPEAIALVCDEQHLSYGELNARANQLARYLSTHYALAPEALIALALDRSLLMLIGLLAILKAGAAYVPLDPDYPQHRLAFVLQETRAPVVLTQSSLESRIPTHQGATLCLDREWPAISHQPITWRLPRIEAQQLAYTIYTSGSTGTPKGVQISHRALVNFLSSMRHQPGLTQQDTLLAVTSISFDIAGLELWLPLMVGARLVLLSRAVSRDGEQLKQQLAEQEATIMQATPTTWRLLLEAGWCSRSEMRLLCGGEALPPELARELCRQPATLWNLYGPTETTIWSTLQQVGVVEGSVSIGRPIANTQIYLLDQYQQQVLLGVVGELCIGGDGLSRGYLYQPDLTAEKFRPDPFSPLPGARLYHTGDLARYRSDGSLEILGRRDSQIKMWGYRIELGEIEATLAHHPAVSAAVVVLQEGEAGEKRLIAYIVPPQHEQAALTNEVEAIFAAKETQAAVDLRGFLRERLPAYMVPSIVIPIPALPLLPNGKVDRRSLSSPEWLAQVAPELALQFQELDADEKPRTPIEQQLVAIWSQLLRLERVGIHQDFFQLGGHSLLATQVIARIRAAFQIELSLQSFFVVPTIAAMALTIEEQQRQQSNGQMVVIQKAEQIEGATLLEQLDQLSDEEMEALFATMVTEEEIEE